MRLKFFISLAFLFTSGQAFAAKYCTTKPNSFDIALSNIVIPPGAQVGDVVAKSAMISKTITCNGAPNPLVAYTNTSENRPTGVYVDFPTDPAGGAYSENCEAMESGFPGLGIAWVNFNTGANKWICASINPSKIIARGLPQYGANTIYDQIILVKTGPIGNQSGENEIFDFNKVFQFNERKDAPGFIPDYGSLYRLTLKGNTVIQAPVCKASSASNLFEFPTKNAMDRGYTTSPSQIINIDCDGVIEDGTVAYFKPVSSYGKFALDNDYFATSEPGLGVSVKYTEGGNITSQTITPRDYFNIHIVNNKSVVKLNYTPYIKDGSLIYPLNEDVLFDLKLSNGNDGQK